MKIIRSVHNSFLVNSYLLIADNNDACIIDPGFTSPYSWEQVKQKITDDRLSLTMVCITHAHADHIAGVAMVNHDFPQVPLYMHAQGESLYHSYNRYAHLMGFPVIDTMPQPDYTLQHHTLLQLGNTDIQVLFTPGHAEGSVSYYVPAEQVVFTGDLLFRMGVGRTDMPGGDYALLEKSIRNEIYTLPNNTMVLPGHGDESDILFEKENNPFVNQINNI